MKTAKVYFNDDELSSEVMYGIFIAETSLTALMTPPPLKQYITNKSALVNGTYAVTQTNAIPKIDERDVQIVFGLKAKSMAQFISRYHAFCKILSKGKIDLTIELTENDFAFKETYHLLYTSCSQYSEYNGRLARFVLKLVEPDPTNREMITMKQ